MEKTLIVIAGPTASGKTALSISLAEKFGSEIISADSRQFYRKMDIGTSKPTKEELSRVPHHLIDSLDITDKYNIGKFESDGLRLTSELFLKHDLLFLTGGSGLYIDALCHGMDELPDSSPEIRDELNRIFQTEGIESLQRKLLETDPEYYADADINNPHRIIRALEVFMIGGKKYSSLRNKIRKKREFKVRKFGLLIDRDELHERINDRVDDMIKRGLVKEVESLIQYRHENAMQTVGYKEIIDYLDHKLSLDEAIALIKQNTRNYAKRQMTWFRRDPELKWFYPEEIYNQIEILD